MGFSELKRKVGIESSGHLMFHLGKLDGLVKTTLEGNYALTDDGREALRLLETIDRTKGIKANEMTKDYFIGDMCKRIQMTIILVAIIIIMSLILSAFMPFDLYQKITMAIIISNRLFFIVSPSWILLTISLTLSILLSILALAGFLSIIFSLRAL